jgi:hypothetical protein
MDGPAWILAAAVRRMPDERGAWGAAMQAELAHIRQPIKRWQFVSGCVCVALFPPDSQGSRMNAWLKHWLSVFGPAAVLALVFAGPAAVEHGWDQPIRLGNITVRIVPGGWLIFAVIFTLIVYRHSTGEPQRLRDGLMTFGSAALFGLLAVGPFAFMEVYNNPGIRSGEFAFPYGLFHGMWLFPTMLFLAATPIVRGVRAEESVLAHPIALVLRIAFLTLVAAGWLFMLWDQMPCFLGGVPGCD